MNENPCSSQLRRLLLACESRTMLLRELNLLWNVIVAMLRDDIGETCEHGDAPMYTSG